MAEELKEPLEFVFLWWSDSDHGVILTREDHSFVVTFHIAKRTARTWGEFLAMLGDDAGYLDDFMQFDELKPEEGDLLENLHGVWVLDDTEFPLTQSAQECFELHGEHFPQCEVAVTIRTEYGMPLELFPKTAYLALKSHMTELGLRVSEEMATFSMDIYPY